MTWYSAGTASVRNGNKAVTIVGGDLINNLIQPGDAFLIRGGQPSEIARLISATQFELVNAWGGGDADGLAYSIQPTTDYQRVLATRLAAMVGDYQTVLDGPARGMFGDGTVAAPGIRFTADQDTGVGRLGPNLLALIAGGAASLYVNGQSVGIGTSGPISKLHVNSGSTDPTYVTAGNNNGGAMIGVTSAGLPQIMNFAGGGMAFGAYNAGGAQTEYGRFDANGSFGIGTTAPARKLHVHAGAIVNTTQGGAAYYYSGNNDGVANFKYSYMAMASGTVTFGRVSDDLATNTEYCRLDQSGNLLVGATSGANHIIAKSVGQGSTIFNVSSTAAGGGTCAVFAGVSAYAPNGSGAAFYVGHSTATNRSINASGTINASGADYAEYMTKADGCGTIAKGDVCGVDREGRLVRTWADAVRYVVKSTDPNLVGGDTWASHLDPRPQEPGYVVPVYEGPADPVEPMIGDDPTEDEQRLYALALQQYGADQATYRAAQSEHAATVAAAEAAHFAAMQAYAAALPLWEADLEAARQTVDRIAFSGQVPVNVDADTLAACEAALADGAAIYLVAVANGGGIGLSAVREDAMTLPLYMRRVGCVWAVRDGRPWIDVQHG